MARDEKAWARWRCLWLSSSHWIQSFHQVPLVNHHQIWHTFPFNCWQKAQEETKNNPKLVLNIEVYTLQRLCLLGLCATRWDMRSINYRNIWDTFCVLTQRTHWIEQYNWYLLSDNFSEQDTLPEYNVPLNQGTVIFNRASRHFVFHIRLLRLFRWCLWQLDIESPGIVFRRWGSV